jgi:hypothetical protein
MERTGAVAADAVVAVSRPAQIAASKETRTRPTILWIGR